MEAVITYLLEHPTLMPMGFASIIAIVGIRKQRQSAREKNSIDFESGYKRSKQINDAWIILMKAVRNSNNVPIESWASQDKFASTEASAIRLILNEWERAASGISHSIYDNDLLYKTYGTTVIDLYTFLRPFITEKQRHNPRFYAQFAKLAVCWMVLRSNENRERVDAQLRLAYSMLNQYLKR